MDNCTPNYVKFWCVFCATNELKKICLQVLVKCAKIFKEKYKDG